MKKLAFLIAAPLLLAACDSPSKSAPPPDQNPPVAEPNPDCTYDDGKPC